MTKFVRGGLLMAALGSFGFGQTAQAQDAALEMTAETGPDADAAEPEEKASPMNWLGIGIKLGAGGNGEGELETELGTTTVASRAGFQMSMPLNFGGDGFGWVIEP